MARRIEYADMSHSHKAAKRSLIMELLRRTADNKRREELKAKIKSLLRKN